MPASYSQLSTYETCALKYRFRYKDGLRTPKGAAASRGSELHASAEAYLRGEKTTIRKELKLLRGILVFVKKQDPLVEQKMALQSDMKTWCDWDDERAFFRLVIDSAYISGNEAHIQEWKSGKMYEDHGDQRRLYLLGALSVWNAMNYATVTTYYLDLNKKMTLRMGQGGRAKLAEEYKRRVLLMNKDEHFAPRPGRYCFWCDYSRRKGGPCPVA